MPNRSEYQLGSKFESRRNGLLEKKAKRVGFSQNLSEASHGAYQFLEHQRTRESKAGTVDVPDYASAIDFEASVGLAPDFVQQVIEAVHPLFQEHVISFSDESDDFSMLEINVGNTARDVITVKIVSSGNERLVYLQQILKKNLSEKQIATELVKMRLIILVITPEMSQQKIEHRFRSNLKDLGFTI
jgi:hypothetical protein